MGHTKEAAKYARQNCFAMLDYNALNSLFLSLTPDDEFSFRVRLYGKTQNWVSLYFFPCDFPVLKMMRGIINILFFFLIA